LNRALETILGGMVALMVTSVVWPRYARDEFLVVGRSALATAAKIAVDAVRATAQKREAASETEENFFRQQMIVLRNLLQAGARESTYFTAALANYQAFAAALSDLFHSSLELRAPHPEAEELFDLVRPELDVVATALEKETQALQGQPPISDPTDLASAYDALEQKIVTLYHQEVFKNRTTTTNRLFLGHFAVLENIRDELDRLRRALLGLPTRDKPAVPVEHGWHLLPKIDWFWIRMATKAGFSAVIGVLMLRWIHPPGSTSVPLACFSFAFLAKGFLAAGGSGDLRAFQKIVLAVAVLFGVGCIFLLIFPFLSNYWLMNFALFGIAFGFGFLTAKIQGFSFWSLFSILVISAFVGLNPEQPVGAIDIIHSFVGLLTGLAVAVVVGRTFWPVLPQFVLWDDLKRTLTLLGGLIDGSPDHLRLRNQCTQLPVEARQASRQIPASGCSSEEKEKIGRFISVIQTLTTQLAGLVRQRSKIPPDIGRELSPAFQRLDKQFQQALTMLAQSLKPKKTCASFPGMDEALRELDEIIEKLWRELVQPGEGNRVPTQLLKWANRYHNVAGNLEKARQIRGTLNVKRYFCDFAL
jgi:uncharacterized membrane protein YccC